MTRRRRAALAGLSVALSLASACGGGDRLNHAPRAGDGPTAGVSATPTASPPSPPATPAEGPKADVPVFHRSRNLMGTVFQITAAGLETPAATRAMDDALAEIARIESVLSEWQPTSEISRINQAGGGEAVKVGPDTLAVVRAGLEVSAWSGGAFDLTWAALHGLYDFRPEHHRAPTAAELRPRLKLIDWKRVTLDEAAATVRLATKGMAIGTGGIGKGYALDRARDLLLSRGIRDFMIFGGGQVTVQGKRGHRAWKVGIQHPRRPDFFAFLEADAGSIGTSGDYEHGFTDEKGRFWHHIIDTRTGYPAKGTLSVTVLAADGLYADALSKPVFIGGPKEGLAFLARLPVKAEAIIVDEDFRVWTTPGTEKRLTFTMGLTNGVLEH